MRYSTTEFETLYKRCFPPSMNLAMGMLHDEDEARDVDDIDINDRNDEIRVAVHKWLTPREQEVVNRIYTESMSYKEAAQDLGVSVAAVNKNVVSALKKLRTHLKIRKS